MNVVRICLVLMVLLAPVSRWGMAAGQSGPSPTPRMLNALFVGRWVGTLEYRDFGNDQRVILPTWLTMAPGIDGNTVEASYIYDDGPTKIVRENSTLTFNVAESKATVRSDGEKSGDSYVVVGLTEFVKTGRGVLTLTGKGRENDGPVDVRITMSLFRNLYTYRKETRLSGEEFKFRDAYTFTRVEPPADGAAPPH